MKRIVIAFLLGAAVMAAGGYGAGFRPTRGPEAPVTASVAPSPATPTVSAPTQPTTTASDTPKAAARPTPPPAAKADFGVTRTLVDTSKATAEACLQFTEPLSTDTAVHYQDYVQLDPKRDVAIRVQGERLCIAGLGFLPKNQDYKVQLAAGLPAASGAKLTGAETVTVSLGELPPKVSLSSNGFILPREGADGLPVQTINADRVKVTVSRVGDRILARSAMVRGESGGDEYYYSSSIAPSSTTTPVWKGEMKVERVTNQRVTTMFPLADVLKPRRPGAYVVEVRIPNDKAADQPSDSDDEEGSSSYVDRAQQWVIDTDMALTTLRGADGLHVLVRSLDSAKPLAGVQLSLIAVNNDELGVAKTDASGHVRFDPALLRGKAGVAPSAIMAYGAGDDFAMLDLKRPGFDLSDRGVSGRATPGPVDGFLYTDRGIYRPGETVHLSALIRDRLSQSQDGVPVIVSVTRPSGVAFKRIPITTKDGAATFDVTLADTAPRGLWSAVATIGKDETVVGKVEFDVQDFVPQRLKVQIATTATALSADSPAKVDLNSRFLYGAPAAGLTTEGELKLSAATEPFAMYKGYRVGKFDDRYAGGASPIELEATDAEGKASASVTLDKLPETSRVLKADIRLGVFEPGGRVTSDNLSLPVANLKTALGLRPKFADERVGEGASAAFDVMVFDGVGQPVAKRGIRYEFIREQWDYDWFYRDGRWQYQVTVRDRPIRAATIDFDGSKPVEIAEPTSWGRYRVVLTDPETGAVTSMRYRGGWGATVDADDVPDKVDVSVERPQYKVGETAKIAVKPPFAGELQITVAADQVFETRSISVPAEGTVVEVPVKAEWGTGAYVLASFYRPLSQGRARDVVRAVGLVWVGIDSADRTLKVETTLPDKVTPRQKLTLDFKVSGVKAGEATHLTLAAVDEGILQLTRFQSPQPEKFYFGKRRLGVDIRDDYARLLDPNGTVGQIRSGGDGIGGRGLPVVPTKSVALFSGILDVDAQGMVHVPVDIPDFNGQLRLMAVAWSKTAIGSGEAALTVRDPVVAELILPRFLGPGDKSRMTLQLHNVDGQAGDYKVRIGTKGAVALGQAGEATYALGSGVQKIETVALEGKGSGIGTLTLAVDGPGFSVARDYGITVRSPYYPLTVEQAAVQAKDADFAVDPKLLEAFERDGLTVALNYTTVPNIDVAGLLQALDRYPFGCTEQITSRAMPLLAFSDPGLLTLAPNDKGVPWRVQTAVDQVLERQDASGGFGLWRVGDDSATAWLQAYATDFLMRAKAGGFDVPDEALAKAIKNLNGAYGYYVQARARQVDIGVLRRSFDTMRDAGNPTAANAGYMGAALALMGDRTRAAAAFALAIRRIDAPINPRTGRRYYDSDYDYYQTPLRDVGMLIALAAEVGQTDILPRLQTELEKRIRKLELLTTQEKAWLVRAAQAQMRSAGPLQLALNDVMQASTNQITSFKPSVEDVQRGFKVGNRSQGQVWRNLVLHGTPVKAPPALANGFTIEKLVLTMTGEPANLATVQQNDRFIISVRGKSTRRDQTQAVLVDMLPAGFEIEASLLPGEDGQSGYDFLPALNNAKIREKRDDRMVTAFDLNTDDGTDSATYHVAYVVRAVTPGSFTMPGAEIEDMYRPQVMARTAVGTVSIAQR